MRLKQKSSAGLNQITPPAGDLERVVYDELLKARDENRAVSRQAISQALASSKKIAPKTAYAVVEEYCYEYSPSTPEFLGNEFLVPYMKVTALVFTIMGLGMLAIGMKFLGSQHPFWMIPAGVTLLALGTFGWAKSLYKEKHKD